jgi:hypothetical protein
MKATFSLTFLLLALNAFSQPTCLEAHYPFSGNANDTSGNNFNGIAQNGVTPAADRNNNPNSAYQFDGIDDMIDLPSDFDYPERTWAMWFYADTITTSMQVLVDADHAGLQHGQTEIALIEDSAINKLYLAVGLNEFYLTINEDEWYHVALVRDSTGAAVYLNGCLVGAGSDTTSASSANGLPAVSLGVNRYHSGFFFKGRMDEVQIYNCALSQPEISVLADSLCFPSSVPETFKSENETVYPNPVTENLFIKNTYSGKARIQVFDFTGKLVFENTGFNDWKINVSLFDNGVYLLRISDNKQASFKKFIVQH